MNHIKSDSYIIPFRNIALIQDSFSPRTLRIYLKEGQDEDGDRFIDVKRCYQNGVEVEFDYVIAQYLMYLSDKER